MENLTNGILAVLIERAKQLDEQAAKDTVELYTLHRVMRSIRSDFASLYENERKVVDRLRADLAQEDPAPVYGALIQWLKET